MPPDLVFNALYLYIRRRAFAISIEHLLVDTEGVQVRHGKAKKYLDSIDMKLTGAGRAKKKSLLASRNPQQSLGASS